MKQTIQLFLQCVLSWFGLEIRPAPQPVNPFTVPIILWNNDEEFLILAKQIEGHTLVEPDRSFIIYQFIKHVRNMNGDVAEAGVYKGGMTKLISKTLAGTSKTVHVFDTFSGMPPSDPTKDMHREGDFSDTSLDSVKEYLEDCRNVRFYQGMIPDTFAHVMNTHFSFAHIDVDIYNSVMDCCIFFYPRMVKGGIIIYDDYGFLSCPGAKMAIDEFFADKKETPCYIPTGQCFIVKI